MSTETGRQTKKYEGDRDLDVPLGFELPALASMELGPHVSKGVVLAWVYDNLDTLWPNLDLAACPGKRAYRLWKLATSDPPVRRRVIRGVLDLQEDPSEEVPLESAVESESDVDGYVAEAEVLCGKLKSYESMMRAWDPHGLTLRLLGEIRAAQREA